VGIPNVSHITKSAGFADYTQRNWQAMDRSAKSSRYGKQQIGSDDRLQAYSNIDRVNELLRPIGRISADAENDKSAQIADCKRVTI
jgi:hypothetical protein